MFLLSTLVEINILAYTGDRVVLPGRAFSNAPITSVNWVRLDLKRAGYAFLSKNGESQPQNQHPYFKNYVELKDNEVSLVLIDAMNVDSGTYECWVSQKGMTYRASIVNLYVKPGEWEESSCLWL